MSQAALIAAINLGNYNVRIENRGEIKRFELANDSLENWPDVINSSLTNITDHTGVDGAFSSFRIRGNQIRATTLSDHRNNHDGRIHLWYSSAWYRTSPNYQYAYWENDQRESRARLTNSKRVFYPLDYWNDGTKPNYAGNSRLVQTIEFKNHRSTSSFIDINVAPAYKQANEPGILCESSLNLPTSATAGLIHLRQFRENVDQGHFGDWNGNDRTIVKRGVTEYFVSPGEMMLKILQSGGGGNNGSYDDLGDQWDTSNLMVKSWVLS
jgi:hypothetical protein